MESQVIQNMIYEIRGYRVMLDFELAEMYEVETRRLNEAVKRNIKRFPSDFMFQLTKEEWKNLMSQNATSSWGGTRKSPYVFLELQDEENLKAVNELSEDTQKALMTFIWLLPNLSKRKKLKKIPVSRLGFDCQVN